MKNYAREEDRIVVPQFNEANGFYTSEKRSMQMARIRARNTKPEVLLRRSLWAAGLRYRLHYKKLPGKPDIVLKKYRLAIFVDGRFWHGYQFDPQKLKSNQAFWIPKIQRNMQRDAEVNQDLKQMGFVVLRFWDHEVLQNPGACVRRILGHVHAIQFPET